MKFFYFAFLAISSCIVLSDNDECILFQSGLLAQSEWKNDLPGLYDDSAVIQLDGQEAINELLNDKHLNDYSDLMIAYHPQCRHCSTIVDSVKSFAE